MSYLSLHVIPEFTCHTRAGGYLNVKPEAARSDIRFYFMTCNSFSSGTAFSTSEAKRSISCS